MHACMHVHVLYRGKGNERVIFPKYCRSTMAIRYLSYSLLDSGALVARTRAAAYLGRAVVVQVKMAAATGLAYS